MPHGSACWRRPSPGDTGHEEHQTAKGNQNVRIAPARSFVGSVQVFVSGARLRAAVVLVALGHVDIHRHTVFCNGRVAPVPLGRAVQIGRIQIRPQGDRTGHGLSSRGVPGSVDAARIHRKIPDEIFRQFDGLPGRSFVPVCELRGDHDHLRVQLCPGGKAAPIYVAPGGGFTEPHHVVPRHDHHKRVFPAAVIAFRQVIAVMDIAVCAGEDLLGNQAELHRRRGFRCAFGLFPGRIGRHFRIRLWLCCGSRRHIRFGG